jgi:hypothetical protein
MEITTLRIFSETVKIDGDKIWVRPVCNFFQIDVRNQHKNIKKDAILSKMVGKNTPSLGEIDDYGRIWLTKKGFSRWIQIINPNIIPDELREQFIEFQSMLDDFLYGSAELHTAIRKTRAELDEWTAMYSTSGNMVKRKKKELDELLNNMFQYRLPFNETKQLQ